MFMDFNWEFRFPSVGNYILLKKWFSATTLHHGLLYRGKQSYLSPSLSSLFSIRFVGPLQFFLASLLVDHISASLCFPWAGGTLLCPAEMVGRGYEIGFKKKANSPTRSPKSLGELMTYESRKKRSYFE